MVKGWAEPEAAEAIVLNGMPWMALVERGGTVIAWNAAAQCGDAWWPGGIALESVLTAQEISTGERRFPAMLARAHDAPLAVQVSVADWTWAGQPCRLLLLDSEADLGAVPGLSTAEASFLKDVLHATPEATAITLGGRVLHVNREFTRLFGYSREQLLGQDLDQLVIPDGRLHEAELLLHGLEAQGRTSIETVRQTLSGELVAVAVLMSRVRLGGESRGLMVTYRDIRRQKQEEARLEHTALHDALTGLGNRTLFLNRLELTMSRLRRRPDRRFAVVFLDLDGFKQVNDTLGHALGDALLLRIAARLVRSVRPQDTVARFGGDEFAILLDDVDGADHLENLLLRLQANVSKVMILEDREARVTASMGAVVAEASCAAADLLLREADQAMYAAKAAGKARHRIAPRCPGSESVLEAA